MMDSNSDRTFVDQQRSQNIVLESCDSHSKTDSHVDRVSDQIRPPHYCLEYDDESVGIYDDNSDGELKEVTINLKH